MTSCPACALPSPQSQGHCAFCGVELLHAVPTLARMSRSGEVFTFTTGDRSLAVAEREGGLWKLTTLGGQTFNLVTLKDESGVEVVLFDGGLNAVVSLRQHGLPGVVTVTNASNQAVGLVREDGLGGLHLIDMKGNAVLFAGRNGLCPHTLDLLITDAGAVRPIVSLFAVAVALEAEQLGPLYNRREPDRFKI